MKYTSKPITPVEAVLWTGHNIEEVQAVCPEARERNPENGPYILELPSGIIAMPGEFVTMDMKGMYSKMGAEIFEVLYKAQ